jgi:hypothetical protein
LITTEKAVNMLSGVVEMYSGGFEGIIEAHTFRKCIEKAIAKLIQQLARRWKSGLLESKDNISVLTLLHIGEKCKRCEQCVITGTGLFH